MVRRGNGAQRRTESAPLTPKLPALRAGLYGLAAAGALLDDDSEDAEEKRRRILAQQEAENFGAVLGLAAGAAIALTRKAEKDAEHEIIEQQTIGGL